MLKNNLILILYPFLFFYGVKAIEWNCASSTNTGTFTRSTDCTITGSNHVDVSNTLEIVGSNEDMNNLITITAATSKRHFYLNNANAKLILRYLKLVGGDVSSYSSDSIDGLGGSILIYRPNGGELNLYSSIVFNNEARYGGGIWARGASSTNKNAIMNIYNSIIQNNEATGNGGGISIGRAVGTVYNTTIDNNLAIYNAYGGGGGMVIYNSNVTMKYTIISNNKVKGLRVHVGRGNFYGDGGGLAIGGDSTTVTLRQSSFINNDATGNGDEIYTSGSPTISLINTYFNNPNNYNNIYVDTHYAGTTTWKTCSDNICTESPFTGTCSAVNNGNSRLGVICLIQCPAGKFKVNEQLCKLCDKGKFNDLEGQLSSTSCKLCDKGKFNDLEGQAFCKNCGKGKYNILQQSSEESACLPCVAGKYTDSVAKSSCTSCPSNKPLSQDYRNAQTSLSSCVATTNVNCRIEEVYSYIQAKGSTCSEPITTEANCKTAATNNKDNDIDTNTGFNTTVNTTTLPYGCFRTTSNKYTFNSNTQSNVDCSKGNTCICNTKQCAKCPHGRYTNGGNVVKCTDICPKGFYCPTGKESIPCGTGKYNNVLKQTTESACKSCETGKYHDLTGQESESSCKSCEKGRYNDLLAQQECKSCLKGTYNDLVGQSTISSCKPCGVGKYNDLIAQISEENACKKCVVGKFNDLTAQQDESNCKACVEGKYNNELGQNECKNCGKGKYSDVGTQQIAETVCKACASGMYNTEQGQTSCKICAQGYSCKDPSEGAQKCPSGTYQDKSGSTTCKNCAAGKYSNVEGQTEETTCKNCATGKHAIQPGSYECKGMKCDIKFKVRDATASGHTCVDKLCVDVKEDYCTQAAVALFSKENEFVSHDSCGKKCQDTLNLENLVQELYTLNLIDMFVAIFATFIYFYSYLKYRKGHRKSMRMKAVGKFLLVLGFVDFVLQTWALVNTVEGSNLAKQFKSAGCTNLNYGREHYATLVKLEESLGTAAILGFIELAVMFLEVVQIVLDLRSDDEKLDSIIYWVAATSQVVECTLAIVDFSTFSVQANKEAYKLFNAALDFEDVNSNEWCIDLTNTSRKCLSNIRLASENAIAVASQGSINMPFMKIECIIVIFISYVYMST